MFMCNLIRLVTFIVVGVFVAVSLCFADGQGRGYDTSAVPTTAATPGSDASFDKRLPPVFPGEEVVDSGKKIKVWSSSGPVPVNPAPEPFQRESDTKVLDAVGGVVVDQRQEQNN